MERFEDRTPFTIENHSQKIFGVLHRPLVKSPAPAVIFCHGYGGIKTGRNRNYVFLAQELSKAGIASIRFDFRGCGDSEGAFSELTYQDHLDDLLKILNHFFVDQELDPNRFGIFGRSLGGALAVQGTVIFKKIRSIALWAPIFNGSLLYGQFGATSLNSQILFVIQKKMRVNGQYPHINFLKQVAELNLMQELCQLDSIPLLHIHGKLDSTISLDHATAYAKCREGSTAETKFIQLNQGDHDFSLPEDQEYAIKETVNFFKGTL